MRRASVRAWCDVPCYEKRWEQDIGTVLGAHFSRYLANRPKLDGIIDALETLWTERREPEAGPPADQGTHRIRDKNLPGVCRVAHPRGHSNGKPDNVAILLGDLAGIDPNPHPNLPSVVGLTVVEGYAFLDALGSNHSIHGGIENGESPIAKILHESAARRGQTVADDPIVLYADFIRNVVAEPVTHSR